MQTEAEMSRVGGGQLPTTRSKQVEHKQIYMETVMTSLTLLGSLSLGEGFGFNGNLLETNILNLSVVLAVVVSLGGDALRSLLQARKQAIVQNLKEVEQRAEEAEEKLNQALAQLELAKGKSSDIREQGVKTSEQERRQVLRQAEEDGNQLKQLQQETLRLQQERAFSQISQQVVSLALQRVRSRFEASLDSRLHNSITNFQIVLFAKYKP